MSSIAAMAAFAALLWMCWKLLMHFVKSSPLDILPGPPRDSWLHGNMARLMALDAWDYHEQLDAEYGSICKIHDMIGQRGLLVSDPKALQSIFIRDQDVFEKPRYLISWDIMVFGLGLLSTEGAHHRKQRKLLNPVFSLGHMRHMTPIFYGVGERLVDAIAVQIKKHKDSHASMGSGKGAKCEVDLLDWMARAALELVGQAGLGYSFDPLLEDMHNEFGDALKRLFPTVSGILPAIFFADKYTAIGSPGFRRYILDNFVPLAKVQEVKSMIDTMHMNSRIVFSEKKRALEKGDEAVARQVGEGKDLLSIMLRENMLTNEEDRLDEEELIGQMSTLVIAATDTTSNALSRILHLLAIHDDVQEKMRSEILEAREEAGGDRIPYDQLVDLPYMDAVCRETLRLYPPVTTLLRSPNKDIHLPSSRPIHNTDGTVVDQVVVPKGTQVIVSLRACNRNKDVWGADAEEWKPERWLSPLPDAVTQARIPGVYANLMTFSGGGRSCIGFKFSQLEMKIVLAVLLQRFRLSLPDKEIVWNLATVTYPSVGKSKSQPSLPLIVDFVDSV